MGCFRRRGYNRKSKYFFLDKKILWKHITCIKKSKLTYYSQPILDRQQRGGGDWKNRALHYHVLREEATNNKTHHWYFLPSRHAWNRQATLTHTARRCSRLVLQSRRGFFIFVIVVGIIMCLTRPLIFSQRGVYPLSSGFATFFNLSGHLDGIFCRKYHLSCFYGINCLCESGFYHAETVCDDK